MVSAILVLGLHSVAAAPGKTLNVRVCMYVGSNPEFIMCIIWIDLNDPPHSLRKVICVP